MAVTLKDVALRAGVSRSAVSRTFTPGASVSPRTRALVEKAAVELGYTPSVLASALSTGRTRLVGLVVDNFRNPAFLDIFDRFTRAIQARGLRPLLVNLAEEAQPDAALRLLRQYSVDGVIIASSTLPPDIAAQLAGLPVPVVHAFGSAPGPVHVVGVDNHAVGVQAAQTLLARGYRTAHVLGGPETAGTTRGRLAGFLSMADRFDVVSHSFASAYSHAAGRAATQALLAIGPHPQALFCGDDVIALGAISALRDAEIAVPAMIGVLGVNDMEMAGWPEYHLSTIGQPIARIVDAAVDLLQAPQDQPPQTRLLPCDLVLRGSLRD